MIGSQQRLADLWGFLTRLPALSWVSCGTFVLADEAAEDGSALDPLLGEVGGRVVGPGRVELAAAMGRRPL